LAKGYPAPEETAMCDFDKLPECGASEDLAVTSISIETPVPKESKQEPATTNNQTETIALKPTAFESTASISNLSQEEGVIGLNIEVPNEGNSGSTAFITIISMMGALMIFAVIGTVVFYIRKKSRQGKKWNGLGSSFTASEDISDLEMDLSPSKCPVSFSNSVAGDKPGRSL
jgi:hypothetical protein